MRARLGYGILALLTLLCACVFLPDTPAVHAAGTLVQRHANSTSSSAGASSISSTYSPAATASNLLIILCSSSVSSVFATPSGFSIAKNENSNVSQAIFYKVASGSESSVSCAPSNGATGALAIQILEYSGMATSSPLDAVNTLSAMGTGSQTLGSGSVTTTNATDIIIAAVSQLDTTGISPSGITGSWTNLFFGSQQGSGIYTSGSGKHAVANVLLYGSAIRSVSATGTYVTATSSGSTGDRIGQIAAFKVAASGTLSSDIVDGAGGAITNPSVSLASAPRSFACQTVTGTLGAPSQLIRVTNNTANPAWTLTLAATNGATARWILVSDFPEYDYNDTNASGCTDGTDADTVAGRLTINPSVAQIAVPQSCSASGVSLGASTAFSEGSVNSVTLASAGGSASTSCFWDFTGIALSQTIPSAQPSGSYFINLTVTVTAN